jgi:glycosyltransferase involved in cell wall biosynthesis/GT2 family glycosyltransferase
VPVNQELIVLVPIYGLTSELLSLVDSLAYSSDSRVLNILLDDFSEDDELDHSLEVIEEKYPGKFLILRNSQNKGYLWNVNMIINEYRNSDILVINSDSVIPHNLPSDLLKLADVDKTVATISIWASNGSILTADVKDLDPKQDIEFINSSLTNLRENLLTIPVAVGHVIYYRRAALNVLGNLNEKFSPGYGEEVDYSLRAVRAGFRNVLAEGFFSYHRGKGSFSRIRGESPQRLNDQKIIDDFPDYLSYIQSFEKILNGARTRFKISLFGFSLAVDASCLNYPASGTTSITIAILKRLSMQHKGTVTAIIDREISQDNLKLLLSIENLSVQYLAEAISTSTRFDVFWRPYQIWEEWRLMQTRQLSTAFILGIQDVIAFDNYSYHGSVSTWNDYRNVWTHASNLATGITFISQYSKDRALESGLLTTQKFEVIPNGIDSDEKVEYGSPKAVSNHESGIIILLVGMNFEHKYFNYAFKLVEEFKKREINVRIIRIGHGEFSAPDNSEIDYKDLGEVSDETRDNLFSEASFVLYPSIVEGFGLIPFEAAMHGVFTYSTRQGGLDEYLPQEIPTILNWVPEDDVKQIIDVFTEFNDYSRLIRDHASELTWSQNVIKHELFFREILYAASRQGITNNSPNFFPSSQSTNLIKYYKTIMKHKLLVLSTRILPIGSGSRFLVKRLIKLR